MTRVLGSCAHRRKAPLSVGVSLCTHSSAHAVRRPRSFPSGSRPSRHPCDGEWRDGAAAALAAPLREIRGATPPRAPRRCRHEGTSLPPLAAAGVTAVGRAHDPVGCSTGGVSAYHHPTRRPPCPPGTRWVRVKGAVAPPLPASTTAVSAPSLIRLPHPPPPHYSHLRLQCRRTTLSCVPVELRPFIA